MNKKTVTKFQMRHMVEMSRSTFTRYLNSRREVMQQMGIATKAHTLPPKVVRYILRDLGYE